MGKEKKGKMPDGGIASSAASEKQPEGQGVEGSTADNPAPAARMIPIAQLQIPPQVRSPRDATNIALSIIGGAELPPVLVRPLENGRLELVYGYHRFVAHVVLGLTEISGVVRELSDQEAEQERLRENLFRHELNALERAEHFTRLKDLYEEENPTARWGHAGAAGKRRAFEVAKLATSSFIKVAIQNLGLSERTSSRLAFIGKNLPAPLRERIRRLPIADHQAELEALAKLPDIEKERAVEALRAGEIESVREVADRPKEAGEVPERTSERVPQKVEEKICRVEKAELDLDEIQFYQASPSDFRSALNDDKFDLLLTMPPNPQGGEETTDFARNWMTPAFSALNDAGRACVIIPPYPALIEAYARELEGFDVLSPVPIRYVPLANSEGAPFFHNWFLAFFYGRLEAPFDEDAIHKLVGQLNTIDLPDCPNYRTDFPPELCEALIRTMAGKQKKLSLFDPFAGDGGFLTAGLVCGLKVVGCEDDPDLLQKAARLGITVRNLPSAKKPPKARKTLPKKKAQNKHVRNSKKEKAAS